MSSQRLAFRGVGSLCRGVWSLCRGVALRPRRRRKSGAWVTEVGELLIMAKIPEGTAYASFKGPGRVSGGGFGIPDGVGGFSSGGGPCLGVTSVGAGAGSEGFFRGFR